jgi:hypothetical protein
LSWNMLLMENSSKEDEDAPDRTYLLTLTCHFTIFLTEPCMLTYVICRFSLRVSRQNTYFSSYFQRSSTVIPYGQRILGVQYSIPEYITVSSALVTSYLKYSVPILQRYNCLSYFLFLFSNLQVNFSLIQKAIFCRVSSYMHQAKFMSICSYMHLMVSLSHFSVVVPGKTCSMCFSSVYNGIGWAFISV